MSKPAEHGFKRGGLCMSRCVCGRTFSDPIHGELDPQLQKLKDAARGGRPS